ncbi:MAG: hypothetical protein AB8B47_06300 [Roseobacter sp.]
MTFLKQNVRGFILVAKLSLALAALVVCTHITYAESNEQDDNSDLVFIPPASGLPSDRLGAGTRDIAAENYGSLQLLVPVEGGLTALAKPPLVWKLPDGFRGTMQAQVAPISGSGIGFVQKGALPPGYYALDLTRSDFQLEKGVVYQLTVSLSAEGETIARTQRLVERVPYTGGAPWRDGIWFDALAQLVSVGLNGRVSILDREGLNDLMEAGKLGDSED